MENTAPVALSGMIALDRRMDSLAQNLANINTVGYRADAIRFSTALEHAGATPLAYATAGTEIIDFSEGARVETGAPLDVAVSGGAFLARGGPDGPVYTRDGRMVLTAEGALTGLDGLPMLDPGGSPLQANPKGGPIAIAEDGTLQQDGRRIGALGLFRLADETHARRASDIALSYDGFAEPVNGARGVGVLQGFVEQSNVNPSEVLVQMVEAQRLFDIRSKLISTARELDEGSASLMRI